MGVAILGISPDPVSRLERFSKKQLLAFSLLSDENHEIAENFGVWGEKKFMGKVYDGIHRISFIIGKDGKIEKVFNKFKTADHAQVVLEYLKTHPE
jgi:peroxiredoxin Q/BCP